MEKEFLKMSKYKPYYEKYNKLKEVLDQTFKNIEISEQECSALKKITENYEKET